MRHSVVLLLLFLTTVCAGQTQQRFPFTREEDSDGSRFVWFVYNLSGLSYRYNPAKSFPTCNRFTKLAGKHPQESDVAWWNRFMGLYSGDSANSVMTAQGKIPLATLVKKYGPVQWYAYLHGGPRTISENIYGGRLVFTLPDSTHWTQKDKQFNRKAQKGMFLFERESVIDAEGTESQPFLSIIYQQLPPSVSDLTTFAYNSPRPDAMSVTSIDTVGQSLLYHCSYNNGTDHTVLILYMFVKNTGISLLCDAPTAVYDMMKPEFLSFLQSVYFEH